MSTKRYRVHCGYLCNGQNSWRYCDNLTEANVIAEKIRQKTGAIVAIEEVKNDRS